jgi:hypothetical protein
MKVAHVRENMRLFLFAIGPLYLRCKSVVGPIPNKSNIRAT